MFMKTFKTSRTELFIILLGLICFAATLWYIISSGASGGAKKTSSDVSAQIPFLTNARTADDRVSFLGQFGWEVEPDPIDVRDVTIPALFDETYTEYSNMQKGLGFDLEKYRGCQVRKWVYSVKNYPGRPGGVKATLLISDGRVIGGDISGGGTRRFTHSLLLSQADNEPRADGDNAIKNE